MIEFTAYGRPVTQGSKTIGRARDGRPFVRESSKGWAAWRDTVTTAARAARGRMPTLTGPVEVGLLFVFARPVGHYGTGRNAALLLPSAPPFPGTKGTGDIDKLTRAVFDCLTAAGVIEDDARVVETVQRKVWSAPGGREGVRVVVRPMPTGRTGRVLL